MDTSRSSFKVRLGLFITIGILLFLVAIFFIGKQKNLFDPVFQLSAKFNNVSGLQVGNTVRYSGINVGTVDNIRIVNDSTVRVDMLLKKDVQQFIKVNSQAGIGSEGIIGDRVIVLSNGTSDSPQVKDGQMIRSSEPVETDAIMASLQVTADNAALATNEITEILFKINEGQGTLGRLINDESIANNLDQTIVNLKKGTKGLDENMQAAKDNFLLRGYYKKQAKAKKEKEEKAKEAAEEAAQKAKEKKEKAEKEAKEKEKNKKK